MEGMEELYDRLVAVIRSFGAEFTTVWFPIQVALILLAAAIAFWGATWIRRHIHLKTMLTGWPPLVRQLVFATYDILPFIIFALVTALMKGALQQAATPPPNRIVNIATSLATAWIVISLLAGLLRNHFANRVIAAIAWTIAALSILGLLNSTTAMLKSVEFGAAGNTPITLLLVLKATFFLLVTLWLAVVVGNFLDKRVQHTTDLTPSIQILIGKIIRLTLIALAVVIVLTTVGIDLSALALFSGAIGLGVGIGLQKIVSNLVSGIVLLADKSIKPGDLITVGEDVGWVTTINARYTLVTLRDGREILVPNEDLVTQRVINWSHTNDQVRLEVLFGVSYACDPHVVRKIALDVLTSMSRVLQTPTPTCVLLKFGDFSLDFALRFWINDPIKGVGNLRSEVMLALWDTFKREGIEIPFPVREVRVVNAANNAIEPPARKSAGIA